MRLAIRCVLPVFVGFVLLQAPAGAQSPRLQPENQAIMNELLDRLAEVDDPTLRYEAVADRIEALREAAEDDPALPAVLKTIETDLRSDAASAYGERAVAALARGDQGALEEATAGLISAAAELDDGFTMGNAQLYKIGEAAERLIAGGMAVHDLQGVDKPATLEFLDNAMKVFKAGLATEDFLNGDKPDRARFVRDVVGLFSATSQPGLAGPGGVLFAGATGWSADMWAETTDALDLVGDAMETGNLDTARYQAVVDRIQALKKKGPFGGDTPSEYLKKIAEGMPVFGNLAKALWPENEKLAGIWTEEDEAEADKDGDAESAPSAEPDAAVDPSLPLIVQAHWSRDDMGIREIDIIICPPYPQESLYAGNTYGTTYYLHKSSVCEAAAHSGVTALTSGGAFQIDRFAGRNGDVYTGSLQNDVETTSWNRNWGGFQPIPVGAVATLKFKPE